MSTNVRFKLRRDTAANWNTNNTLLLEGEPGFDITNNQIRIGDGISHWSNLEPINVKNNYGIAVGIGAGINQDASTIAIGTSAGSSSQQLNSIAIGNSAGLVNQGINSIAIGTLSGKASQADNTIIFLNFFF